MPFRSSGLYAMLSLMPVLFAYAAQGGDWSMRLNDRGAVEISCRNKPVVTSHSLFLGPDGKEASAKWKVDRKADGSADLVAKIEDLGTTIRGVVTSPKDNCFQMDFRIEAASALKNVSGGFLWRLDSKPVKWRESSRAPELLADRGGWQWRLGLGRTIRVAFTPRAAEACFAGKQKDRIRTGLFGPSLEAGTTLVTMTVSLPPGGKIVHQTEARREEIAQGD